MAYYYRLTDVHCSKNDIENLSVPLQVNCCGVSEVVNSDYVGGYRCGRRDCYLMYIRSGRLSGIVDGRHLTLSSGEMICMLPRTVCAFRIKSEADLPVEYLWIHFTGAEAEEAIRRSGIEPNEVHKVKPGEELGEHFEKLFQVFALRRPDFDYFAAVELRYILMIFGKSIGESYEVDRRLSSALSYIYMNIGDDIPISTLAELEHLSLSRFREVFREVTGLSPGSYIMQLRLARAKDLLARGELTINAVSSACGFADRLYFQRVFKKYVGITPNEYRLKYSME